MADVFIDFDDGDVQRKTKALALLLSDLRPFWPLVVPLFVGWMKQQFDTEGAFGGDPWAPLSPAYEAAKAVKYPGEGILYATGDLRMAASLPKRDAGPTYLTLTVDDSGYTHGGKDERAVLPYHQEGTDKMPARPLLFGDPMPLAAADELHAATVGYADEIIGRLGL